MFSALEAQWGIVGRVEQVKLNPITLTLQVRGLALSVASTPDHPFLTSEAVTVDLPWSILIGEPAVDLIDIEAPVFSVRRLASGVSNLPVLAINSSSTSSPGAAWRLGVVSVKRAMVFWEDAVGGPNFSVGPASLQLRPSEAAGPETSGRFTISRSTSVNWGAQQTSIEPLTASLTLGSTTLTVHDFVATAPEGRLAATGDIGFGDSSSVGVDYVLDVALDRLSAWFGETASLSGDLRLAGRLESTSGGPAVSLQLEGPRVTWNGLELTEVAAALEFDGQRLTVETLRAGLAGGVIEGGGVIGLTGEETTGDVTLAWTGVSTENLSGALRPAHLVGVASTLGGTAEVSWSGHAPKDLEVWIESHHARPFGAAMPVGGVWRFSTDADGWMVSADELSVGALDLSGVLTGAAPETWADAGAIAITGHIEGRVENLWCFGHEMYGTGLTEALVGLDLTGDASLHVDVSGTASEPELSAELTATGGLLGLADELTLRAAAALTASAWRLGQLDLRVGDSSIDGHFRVGPDTGELLGNLMVRVPDLAQFAVVMPSEWWPAGSLELNGSFAGDWSRPRLEAKLKGFDLSVIGQQFSTLVARLVIDPGRVVLDDVDLRQGDGRLEATAQMTLTTGDYAVLLAGRGLRLAPWRVDEFGLQVFGATVDLDLESNGSIGDPRGAVRLMVRDLVYRDYVIDRSEHVLTFDAGEWRLRSRALTLAAEIDLVVQSESPWRYQLDARLTDTDLQQLVGSTVPSHDRLGGRVSLLATAAGDLADLTASDVVVEVAQLDARLAQTPITLAGPLRLRTTAAGLRFEEPLDLRVGDVRVTGRGALLRGGEASVAGSLTGDLGGLPNWVHERVLSRFQSGVGELAGSFRLDAELTGTFSRPVLRASLAVDDGVVGVAGLAPVTELALRAVYDPMGFRLRSLTGRWQQASLEAEAMAPAPMLAAYLPSWMVDPTVESTGPVTMTATVQGIGAEALGSFVDLTALGPLGGAIDVELSFGAERLDLSAVSGVLTLRELDVNAGGVPVTQQLPTRLRVADGRVTVDALVWQLGNADTTLSLDGHVDLVPELAADLSLTGVADLNMFNAFSSEPALAGDASLVANLRGTLAAPSINGVVEVSDGEMRLSEPRLLVSDLAGALVFDGSTMRTVGLAGTANGGDVQVDGVIRFSGLRPEGTLALTGSGIPLTLPPGVRTELDTDLRLNLSREDAELSGSLTILRGDYREPVDTARGLRALMESRLRPDGFNDDSSVFDALRLNVQVRTEEEVVVNNNYGAGTLAADLRVVGSLGQPGVTGRATIGDGGQVFLGGNTFEIETGIIDFVDPDGFHPELDVTVRTQVGNEEITVTLAGTADTLMTTMRSSSDLPESDIVSLLLTGRTLDRVGNAPVALARDQALGLVSGEMLGAAGRSVGLDTVRLDRGATQGDVRFDSSLIAGETDPGTRLTVGKNLSRQIELVASQNLRESGLVTWIVNYLPRRNLELRLVVDDETDRSYEFRHVLTFGGPRDRSKPQTEELEPRVTMVRFTGNGRVPESELRQLLFVEAGDRFDFLRWQESRDRIERELWDRGFQQARVRARRVPDPTANTVALEFEVETGPRTVIELRGYEPSPDLLNAMQAAWRQSVFETFLVEELDRLLRRYLADEGHLRPTLTMRLRDSADGAEQRLTIDVVTGLRSLDRMIRFIGQEQVTAARLATLVTADRAADAWAGGDELVKAVMGSYRAEGFLEARATRHPPEFDGENATLTVEIVEGPVFRVSEVEVEGAVRWASTRVRAAAGVTPGAVYEPSLGERVRTAILAAYRSDGFTAARLRVLAEVNASDETVSLVVLVDEGRRQLLGRVEVEGASTTSPRVVEQALRLTPGDPVDPARWSQARRRLYDTGVFRSVDITPVASDQGETTVDGENQSVTARVRLEEWPRYRLRYGLQLIDEQAPVGEIDTRGQIGVVADLTRQNFLGRAITLGSAVRYDTVQRAARGFVLFPSFFGRKVRSNLFVSRVRETFGSDGTRVTNDRQGLTLEQQITPREGLTLAYSYNFDRNHTLDVGVDGDPSVYIARFNTSLIADRRDDLFNATRGWFHSSTFEWGAPTLGSDRRFLKYVGQQNYFRPFRHSVVLASSARVGFAADFGQELIFSERFFAGGGTTVRGYPQDGLGPVDFLGHSSGGRAVIVLNQEARFPLWRMLRGVGFVDAGNVFASVGDVSFGRLRVATGLGLRVETPVGLFRVDYGRPLFSTRTDAGGRWFVSLGQAF